MFNFIAWEAIYKSNYSHSLTKSRKFAVRTLKKYHWHHDRKWNGIISALLSCEYIMDQILGYLRCGTFNWLKYQQDGRLAPAYLSPNYKYFDQLLQTVKKTTVLILVFKEFLQTSIRSLISVLYAKGYHDFPLENFCLTVPKNFVEEPFCVSENFWYRKMLGIREGAGITIFCQNSFVSLPKNFVEQPFCVSQNF